MSIVIVGAGQAAALFALSLCHGGPVHRNLSAEIGIKTRARAAA
jgi:hypothetical protein